MTFFYVFWTADSLATKLGLMIHHHKPESPVKKKDYCIQGQGHSEGSKCLCLSRWYLLNHQAIGFQIWYCDASLWVRVSWEMIDLLFSRLGSLQELIWSKYDNFYCIFCIADLFATKLGLIVHYPKRECFMEKNWIVVLVTVKANFQNVVDCLPRWYLLNCWTVY